jgi:hypothetical protein
MPNLLAMVESQYQCKDYFHYLGKRSRLSDWKATCQERACQERAGRLQRRYGIKFAPDEGSCADERDIGGAAMRQPERSL